MRSVNELLYTAKILFSQQYANNELQKDALLKSREEWNEFTK